MAWVGHFEYRKIARSALSQLVLFASLLFTTAASLQEHYADVMEQLVLVLTPESPLGKRLIGQKVGDRVQLDARGPGQELRIVAVE